MTERNLHSNEVVLFKSDLEALDKKIYDLEEDLILANKVIAELKSVLGLTKKYGCNTIDLAVVIAIKGENSALARVNKLREFLISIRGPKIYGNNGDEPYECTRCSGPETAEQALKADDEMID